MKEGFEMTRQTSHPKTRSRRERALAQRKDELQAWESGEAHTKNIRSWVNGADQEDQKNRKIKICKEDIFALERKLFTH